MAHLQEIFSRIQKHQQEQRELKKAYREALASSPSYHDVVSKLQTLKEQKKSIEATIREEFRSEFERLDRLKLDLDTDKTMMTDLAFNQLMKGQTVSVTDEENNQYEPIFSVRFKKIQ